MSSQDIGKILLVSKGNISQLTLKLIEEKLISENRDPKDKRKISWKITEKGKKLSEKLITIFDQIEVSLEKHIVDERNFLVSLLRIRTLS